MLDRIPMDLKVGDKVTSSDLRKNGLFTNTKSTLQQGRKTWTVVEVSEGKTTMVGTARGKKRPAKKTVGITRVKLEAKFDGKLKVARVFWWHS
jgi:hypothetical protein